MGSRAKNVVVDDLVRRVLAGEFDGRALPREQDLADSYEVSRLTLREAVHELTTGGVLRVERGRGTYANPVGRWTDVGHVARAAGDTPATSLHLLQARRLIEVGAVQLATDRLTEDDHTHLAADVERMSATHAVDDVDGFADADLEFHLRILRGTQNPFVPVLYTPIADHLRSARVETSRHPEVRVHAIAHHRQVLAALRDRDADAAAAAMAAHIDQTRADLEDHVLPGAD